MTTLENNKILSFGSSLTIPLSDKKLFEKEAKNEFIKCLICLILDLLLSLGTDVYEFIILSDKKKKFVIHSTGTLLFFILVIVFLGIHNASLAYFSKFFYISIAVAYFLFRLGVSIYNLILSTEQVQSTDLIVFGMIIITIFFRVPCYFYIGAYTNILSQVYEISHNEDHDKFFAKINNKFQRGPTEWSKSLDDSKNILSNRPSNFCYNVNNNSKNGEQIVLQINNEYLNEEEEKKKEENQEDIQNEGK